jgi:hypothetical protein
MYSNLRSCFLSESEFPQIVVKIRNSRKMMDHLEPISYPLRAGGRWLDPATNLQRLIVSRATNLVLLAGTDLLDLTAGSVPTMGETSGNQPIKNTLP